MLRVDVPCRLKPVTAYFLAEMHFTLGVPYLYSDKLSIGYIFNTAVLPLTAAAMYLPFFFGGVCTVKVGHVALPARLLIALV